MPSFLLFGGVWQYFAQALSSGLDSVFSFLFTYFWIPDLFPSATSAITAAMVTFSPYFVMLNGIMPLFLLFQILGIIFMIEMFVLVFKLGLIIMRLIRG